VLAAHRERVHGAIGIQCAHDAGEFGGVGQRGRDAVLDDIRFLGKVPLVRGPNQVGKSVVHHDSAQARHQHPKQTAVRIERSVRSGRLDGVSLHF